MTTQTTRGDDAEKGLRSQDPQSLLDDAYGIVDENIRAGAEEAAERHAKTEDHAPPDMRFLLDRLSSAVAEVGFLSVEIARALAAQLARERAAPDAGQPSAAHSHIPVDVTAAHPVQSAAHLHRVPVGGLSVTALTHEGDGSMIHDVRLGHGPALHVSVPQDISFGRYHGLLVEDGADLPAGTVTLHVIGHAHDG